MKITVAIPCYNLEDRIATCLESVIHQDFQDLEILVIDDYSIDRSVEVVRNLIARYPEREIRHIVNLENLGLCKVRNLAIKKARGEYLYFIDGDDTIEQGTLSLFYHRMEKSHADVVCGSFRKTGFDGNTIVDKQFPEDTIKGEFAFASYIEKHITGYFCLAVWNNLYSLNFLRKHDIRCSTHYRNYEDRLFTFKVVLNASCVSYIHDITYNYNSVVDSIRHQRKDLAFLHTFQTVIESVFGAKRDFEFNHSDLSFPRGILFLLSYICLTNGPLKNVIEADVNKEEKKQFLKWLRQQYRKNNIKWNNIPGPYNKISYLILSSPFPYPLFCYYFSHIKSIAKLVESLRTK